jgi:hypothetical protein
MPVAVLQSRALAGMHAPEVVVEAHIGSGLPSFTVVGLPEAEVKESRDRVRAAIVNSQFEFPMRRVNLAPADLPKESGRLICRWRWVYSPHPARSRERATAASVPRTSNAIARRTQPARIYSNRRLRD